MNIVLADVQPSSINLSEPTAEGGPGDGKFSNLMNRQMDQRDDLPVTAESSQDLDIKEVNANSNAISDPQNEFGADTEVPSAWLEFLANQPIGASTGNPAEPLSVNINESGDIGLTEDLTGLLAKAVNPIVGGLLPGSGNALPSLESQGNSAVAVTAIQTPMLQKDLLHQAKSLNSQAIEQAMVESINSKSTDSRFVDSLQGVRGFELQAPLKTDLTAEALNQFKAPEFQAINNAISELGDTANSHIRTQGPSLAMANTVTQPANQLLPTQLETLTVNNTRDTAAWSSGIGERVHYMINQKMNTATIRLDPPMLGRLDVHIQINDDITNVTINTQHAQTRELIENASFRLREFLQENGYQNVNVDVSQQEQQQQASQQADDGLTDALDDDLSVQSSNTEIEDEGNQYFSSDRVVDYFV